MALSIKSDRADELARELSTLTGESLTDAVTRSLEERLARERALAGMTLFEKLQVLTADFAPLPVHDDRTDDEIIGYDENGLPT